MPEQLGGANEGSDSEEGSDGGWVANQKEDTPSDGGGDSEACEDSSDDDDDDTLAAQDERQDRQEHEIEYEFETITQHRLKANGDTEYLTKWKGYKGKTWEPPASFLAGDPECVDRYHENDRVRTAAIIEETRARKQTQDDATRARGGNVRSMRSTKKTMSEKDRWDRVEALAKKKIAKNPASTYYHRAYEEAQQEVCLEEEQEKKNKK
jgi:hypothetical protein